jgi:hypothetical protein
MLANAVPPRRGYIFKVPSSIQPLVAAKLTPINGELKLGVNPSTKNVLKVLWMPGQGAE